MLGITQRVRKCNSREVVTVLMDTLTPCHSCHLGCCSAFQDGNGTLLGGVELTPGLSPCQAVLRGRMDAPGTVVALTLRSSRQLRGQGQGLCYLGSVEVCPVYRFLESLGVCSKLAVLRSISEKPLGRMTQWLGLLCSFGAGVSVLSWENRAFEHPSRLGLGLQHIC